MADEVAAPTVPQTGDEVAHAAVPQAHLVREILQLIKQMESNQAIILGTVLALQATIDKKLGTVDEKLTNHDGKFEALIATVEGQNNQHLLAMNVMRYTANILQDLPETVRQQGLANTACLNRVHDMIASNTNAIATAANTQLGLAGRIISNQDFMLEKIVYTENESTSWKYEDELLFADDTSGNNAGSD